MIRQLVFGTRKQIQTKQKPVDFPLNVSCRHFSLKEQIQDVPQPKPQTKIQDVHKLFKTSDVLTSRFAAFPVEEQGKRLGLKAVVAY